MRQFLVFICIFLKIQYGFTIFEFPKETSYQSFEKIPISEEQIREATQLGEESIQHQERLEENLISNNIKVTNGSISHAQFLETFPNEEAKKDNYVARKLLKASQYLNAQCKLLNINSCATYFSTIQLPASKLRDECLEITRKDRDGHYAFRRLLPANYKDGLYEMFQVPEIPQPRAISKLAGKSNVIANTLEDNVNLILMQWAQFIEHDLSKSAVATMADGTPIECCNSDFFKLRPRYVHPSCAALEGVSSNAYARISCLNYVRSALAVDRECEFGPAQQLNQATSSLDLSQLYGHTNESKKRMRSFVGGQLKTSDGDLLPLAESKEKFCAFAGNSNKLCFMAGDNRVNSNPFMNFIYTIFLRSHNNIAQKLKRRKPVWSDEQLYNLARQINVNIYRSIIYNEWLPIVLGEEVSNAINSSMNIADIVADDSEKGISNEFAVAAIRFYYSMMPNALLATPFIYQNHLQENVIDANPSTIAPEQIFSIQDQFYKSEFLTNPNKLEIALEAMLKQPAMKMDSQYAESVIKHFLQTELDSDRNMGSDALAWDIQRSRDHGLASYVKYMEACAKRKVNDWNDLQGHVRAQDIQELKGVYADVHDIDLIIGGIFEIPQNGSMLGPTFTCILGEQFSKLRRFEKFNSNEENLLANIIFNEKGRENYYTGSRLLCETTSLETVPKNIFFTLSENRLMDCSDF